MTKASTFLFVLLLGAVCSAGQPLDLQTAMDLAFQNNPSLVALQREKASAEAEVQTERQFANPGLLAETTRSQPYYFVGADYVFELGGKRGKRIEVAKGAVTIAEYNYRLARQNLRHDVRIAFYTLLVAQKKQAEIGRALELSKQLYEIATQRYELGDAARLEVLQTQLEMKRRENDLQQSQSETQTARVQLNTLLHQKPSEPVEINGSEAAPPQISVETLTSGAISNHFSLLVIRQQIQTEQARLNLAQASRIPDLGIEGGVEIDDADFQYGYRAALRLDLPFFNRKQGEILFANVNIERLKAEEQAAIVKLTGDISGAYIRFQTALARTRNYEHEILPVAAEIEQLVLESYQAGKTGILPVIDAQRSLREVRVESLDIELQLQIALADLEQTAGTELK